MLRREKWPNPPEQGEIILKENFVAIENTKTDDVRVIPEITILANRDGLEYLSDLFRFMARNVKPSPQFPQDEENHQHFGEEMTAVNWRLSDSVEFKLGVFDESTRDSVLRKYDVSEQNASHECVTARFLRYLDRVKLGLANRRLNWSIRNYSPPYEDTDA